MESEYTNIYLIGSLGKKFGRHWKLDVKSPSEAVRAIDINTKGELLKYFAGPAKNRYYKVALGKKNNTIFKEEITHRSGRNNIYIIPTIKFSDNAFTKILAGAAFIGLAILSGGTSLAATGFLGGFAAPIAAVGLSLVLGGVVQLLTPVPSSNANSDESTRGSNAFQGNANTISQGGGVPIVYGRALVSPMPISISISNNDLSTTDAGTVGAVERTDLPGGGYQYTSVGIID